MSEGDGLFGQPAAAPRKRGRPKGAKGKRGKDFRSFIVATYGASAAQQSAAMCMVRPAELKAAGGDLAKALVVKAAHLVELVRRAQAERDEAFRQVVRDEFERLLLDVREVTGKELRQAMDVALKRVREAGAGFSLREALDWMAKERAALLPYTDQRQPQAVEVVGDRAPSVVIMGAGPVADVVNLGDVEKVEDFQGFEAEVSQPKSHAESEATEIAGLLAPPAAD